MGKILLCWRLLLLEEFVSVILPFSAVAYMVSPVAVT